MKSQEFFKHDPKVKVLLATDAAGEGINKAMIEIPPKFAGKPPINPELLRPDELPADWNMATDKRLTAWETAHQPILTLESGGESTAAALVSALGENAEIARELAYRLYILCECKKCAAEALSCNSQVQSWPEISRLAQEDVKSRSAQIRLFEETLE